MQHIESNLVSGPAQLATPDFGTEKQPLSGPIPVETEELRFQNQRIRIAIIDGVAQFVAKDVAEVLEYANTRQAVHMHVSKANRDAVCLTDAIGRTQTWTTVNEAGLYELILGSKKPAAREFRDWVVSEVLPSIRKTGRYMLETATIPLSAQIMLMKITGALRYRGASREKQLNRIRAHRDGTFSIRIGRHWVRHLSTLNVAGLPLSHALREGRALSAVREGPGQVRLEPRRAA
jgi:prophage antirepressor-like protein